ncbi:hypothetical protein [Nocardia arizonensis]|uniref:hypothetical protein n=1 Tax=Nocardia arizonensis TaxID=1141647 RepID=UPI000A47A11E|nr:hypothetical protein [Nocardia arizonensis]
MGTAHKPVAARTCALRPAVVLLGGAVVAAVAGTAPALADAHPFAAPVAVAEAPGPAVFALGGPPPVDGLLPTLPGVDLAGLVGSVLGPAPGAVAPMPAAEPVDVPPQSDSDAPPLPRAEEIRIGSIELTRPSTVAPEAAAQINSGAAEVVDGLSDVLDSSGVDPARSDEVADRVVGDSVIGAVVGGVAIAPVAAAVGALVGGVGGFVLGIPFLPTGLVVGPVVGAAMVAAFVVAPAVVTGAVVGAVVGAVQGWNEPLDPPPAVG